MGSYNDNDEFVDASQLNDIINNDSTSYSSPYFCTNVKHLLSFHNRRDPATGEYHQCVATCRYIPSSKNHCKNVRKLVIDSGATCHMRICCEDFEDDYRRSDKAFVLMGDGSKVPVLGVGTSRLKLDGHVIRLENCLHIPSLDADLFSASCHGRTENPGCSTLIGDGRMLLTFPSFCIEREIPHDNDLSFPYESLNASDLALPAGLCNGGARG